MNTDSNKINNKKNDENPMKQQSRVVSLIIEQAGFASESVTNKKEEKEGKTNYQEMKLSCVGKFSSCWQQ